MAGKDITMKAGNASDGNGGSFILEAGKPSGANTGSNIIFKNFASSSAESASETARITYDGKLGIGTASPAQLLDIYGGNIKMATSQSNWAQIGQTIIGEALFDQSGNAVAMNSDGTIIAIGAPYNDGSSDDNSYNSGSVRVYQYSSGTWSQIGQDLDGSSQYLYAGFKNIWLNNDGDRIVIPYYGYGNNTGLVRVYEYNGVDTWTQLGSDTDMQGGSANEYFGWSVCMNSTGSRVAVGVSDYNGEGTDRGRVLVYDYNGTDAWNSVGGATDMVGTGDYDYFGYTVRMSDNGNIVAVSAPQTDSAGTKNGYVEVYEYNGTTTWNILDSTINGANAGDQIGESNGLAINGDGTIIAISSRFNTSNTGYVKLYLYSGGTWSQKGATISGFNTNDYFGEGITLSNNGLIIGVGAWGASSDSSNSTSGRQGEVRIFQYNSSTSDYDQIGEKIYDVQDSHFGAAIRINNAGTKIVCGANLYGKTSTNYFIGATRVYEYASQAVSLLNSSVYGGIGIGTSNIKGSLHVHKKDGHSVLRISNDDNTKYKNVLLFDNDGIFRVKDSNHQIEFDTTNNIMKFSEYGYFTWNNANYPTSYKEIMRLTSSGNLGIGTSIPSEKLHVTGNALIENGLILQDRNKIYMIDDKRNNVWSSFSSTTLPGANTGDDYGSFIKMNKDGTVLAIASPDESTGALTNNGTVYIYKFSNGSWILMDAKIEGPETLNVLSSIDLNANGNIIIIGYRAYGDGGYAIVYEYSDGSWSQKGDAKTGSNTDDLGDSVKINDEGNIIAISERSHDFNGKASRGRTRFFKYNSSGDSWDVFGDSIYGEDANDEAVCVAMNSTGYIVAIGAKNNDDAGTDRGQVEVYEYNENTNRWNQLGSDLYGEANNDSMPKSASFNADGTILALSSNVNAAGGTGRGHVRIYQYSSSSWSQLGTDIDGTSDNDVFGTSCQLSSDGYTIIIGANQDINGDGYVKIYNFVDGDWTLIETIATTGTSHQFGYSVSCSADANIVAITSKQYDLNRGKVTTYRRGHSFSNIEIINSATSISASSSALQLTSNSVTFTLPTADGTSGQVLSTNGSGTLSWSNGGGGASALNDLTDVSYANGDLSITSLDTINFTGGTESVASTGGSLQLKSNSVTFTLPTADGTNGQVLSTNGSGTLSWTTASGDITAAGNNTFTGDNVFEAALTLGDGTSSGTLKSNGDYDLVLQTGNATTGTVTITDGANGDITVAPNGTGRLVVIGGIQLEGQVISVAVWWVVINCC
jgi:hypothetical protein